MSEEKEALLTRIRVIERFYQEQWDRALRLLNSAAPERRNAAVRSGS